MNRKSIISFTVALVLMLSCLTGQVLAKNCSITNKVGIEVLQVTKDSIKLDVTYPTPGTWGNVLSLLDTSTGSWEEFDKQDPYIAPFKGNGIYKRDGLKPNNKYGLFISWYNPTKGIYEDLQIIYVTTEKDSAKHNKNRNISNKAGLQVTKITKNSISVDASFPNPGTWGNHIAILDTSTNQWSNFNGQDPYTAPYRGNGEYVQKGLKPNTTYKLFISWYNPEKDVYEDLAILDVMTPK